MSKRTFEDLRDMLKHELDAITKKGDITKESLDNIQKLTSTLKNIEVMMQKEEGSEGGQSMMMPYSRYMPMGSYDGQSMNRGSYNQGGGSYNSYNQGGSNQGGSYDGGSYNAGGSSNRGGSYDGGNSGRGSYDGGSYDGGSYDGRRGRDGDSDGRYSEEGSYRRGRDARGRYTSRDAGYSGHTDRERMIGKLETMMDDATTERERKAIQRCIDQIEG